MSPLLNIVSHIDEDDENEDETDWTRAFDKHLQNVTISIYEKRTILNRTAYNDDGLQDLDFDSLPNPWKLPPPHS